MQVNWPAAHLYLSASHVRLNAMIHTGFTQARTQTKQSRLFLAHLLQKLLQAAPCALSQQQ
jgi:hypothetical protein